MFLSFPDHGDSVNQGGFHRVRVIILVKIILVVLLVGLVGLL